jgi:hypothetical protein
MNRSMMSDLVRLDRDYVWHRFTQCPVLLAKAERMHWIRCSQFVGALRKAEVSTAEFSLGSFRGRFEFAGAHRSLEGLPRIQTAREFPFRQIPPSALSWARGHVPAAVVIDRKCWACALAIGISPDHLHSVRAKGGIVRHNGQVLRQRHRHQQPVKRIAMVRRQFLHSRGMSPIHRPPGRFFRAYSGGLRRVEALCRRAMSWLLGEGWFRSCGNVR